MDHDPSTPSRIATGPPIGSPSNVIVSKVADHTTALIANATPAQLAAAMEPWSLTEEFIGAVSAAQLSQMMQRLLPLLSVTGIAVCKTVTALGLRVRNQRGTQCYL